MSETLPLEILRSTPKDLLALGFTFQGEVTGDPLFQRVTLPEGWTVEWEGGYWSYVKDERGIARVAVFYKSAFYDRRAHMNLVNVGGAVAQDWIYADDEQSLHPLLTDDELEAARLGAESYIADAERHPDIYGDRLPRAWSLIAALAARGCSA